MTNYAFEEASVAIISQILGIINSVHKLLSEELFYVFFSRHSFFISYHIRELVQHFEAICLFG